MGSLVIIAHQLMGKNPKITKQRGRIASKPRILCITAGRRQGMMQAELGVVSDTVVGFI